VTVDGGLRQGSRVTTLYRFTDEPVYDIPGHGIEAMNPTNEFLKYESIETAQAGLEAGVQKLKEEGRRKQQTKGARRTATKEVPV
jgi:hypothetical protein